MTALDDWVKEVRAAVDALVPGRGLGIGQPPDRALSQQVALAGFPGVLPLWGARRTLFGLRVVPGADPRAWPGVFIQDGQGLTLATDARTLVPQAIVNRHLSGDPAAAERLAGEWGEAGPGTLALHRALGGADEALDAVVATLGEPAAREAFRWREGKEAEFEAAHSALARKIDASPAFVRYADWLDGCIAGACAAPEDAPAFGAWERRVLCLASRLALSRPGTPKLGAPLVLRVVEPDAGIDSAVPGEPSWSIQPGGASGETTLVEAAASLGDEPPADPVAAGLVRALTTEGSSYRGLAHAEAVVALDEGGEPERAWGALQSAAWWAARNTGGVPPAMFEGARFLSERHGWADVGWVVQRAAKLGG